jgi:phosphate transport system substrate-binding protein
MHISDYRLIAKLGRGRYTEVFLALPRFTVDPAELVALTRVRVDAPAEPKLSDDDAAGLLERARIALRLRHPNIARTYAIGRERGLPYCAVEYLAGQPLDRVLQATRAQGFPRPLGLRIVSDVICALEYAHALNDEAGNPLQLVHGEVQPRNVFVTYQGDVKLIGFGSSELVRSRAGAAASLPTALDQRDDVFGIGAILWDCLTLQPLAELTGSYGPESLHGQPLPSVASRCAEIDPSFAALCDRALDVEPANRPANASALREEFDQALVGACADQDELSSFMQQLFEAERTDRASRIAALLVEPQAPASIPNPQPPAAPEPHDSGDRVQLALPQQHSTPSVIPPSATRKRAAGVAGLLLVLGVVAGAVAFQRASRKPAAPTAPAGLVKAVAAPAAVALRLCGSNTVGAELAPALVEALLVSKGAPDVVRRTFTNSARTTLQATLGSNPLSIEIDAEGSATAFTGLAAGSCDVGMASRAIDDAEVATLRERGHGDLRSAATEHVIALDGIAVIVHPNNPLRALNRAALHDVFAGSITDWAALGGNPGPIHVLARDAKSGTFDVVKHLVLGKSDLTSSAQRFARSEALAAAVAADSAAIGFVGFPYVRTAKVLAVGEVGATPLRPSRFTVATEGYMLSRRLYLYTLPKPRTPLATDLVNFALSRAAQSVVIGSQFIDLGITSRSEPCNARCPERYAATIAKAERLSLDFRFRSGSDELDSRADRDIDRLISHLAERAPGRVLLLGFSDAVGNASANERLSTKRAKAVADSLAARGIRAAVVSGFGAVMPVGSNDSESGRQRNRRVEVWVR